MLINVFYSTSLCVYRARYNIIFLFGKEKLPSESTTSCIYPTDTQMNSKNNVGIFVIQWFRCHKLFRGLYSNVLHYRNLLLQEKFPLWWSIKKYNTLKASFNQSLEFYILAKSLVSHHSVVAQIPRYQSSSNLRLRSINFMFFGYYFHHIATTATV